MLLFTPSGGDFEGVVVVPTNRCGTSVLVVVAGRTGGVASLSGHILQPLGRVARLLDHLPFFCSRGYFPRVEGEFVPVCLGVESFRGDSGK